MATTQQNVSVPVIPIHDAVLPYDYDGVRFAIVNLGDNVETNNTSAAELFERVNRNLLVLTNLRDCFVPNPPSIDCVKAHHNMYVRLIRFIDSRTKKDNQSRLVAQHISPERRKFTRYPVRYFDQKNPWTVRWTELYLYFLSNLAQMAELNSWSHDWTEVSATELKRLVNEAYRLMAIDLFGKDLEVYKDDKNVPLLSGEDFDNYNPSSFVPVYEYLDHPTLFAFSDDRLRDVSTPVIKPGVGVTSTGGDTLSPGEVDERRVREAQRNNPIVP